MSNKYGYIKRNLLLNSGVHNGGNVMLKIRKNYKAILATIIVILLLSSLLFIGLTTNKALSTDEMNMTASAGANNPNSVADSTGTYASDSFTVYHGAYTIACTFKAVNGAFWTPDYFEYEISVSPAALQGLKLTVEFHDSVANPIRYKSFDMSKHNYKKGEFKTAANLIDKMVAVLTVDNTVLYSKTFDI